MTDRGIACGQCGQYHKGCTAHSKRHGRPCPKTPMPGLTVCYWHGGNAPAARLAGQRRLVEKHINEVAAALEVEPLHDPWEALAQLGGRCFQVEQLLRERLGDIRDANLGAPVALAYERALDRAVKVTLDMSKLDLDESRLRLDKARAAIATFAFHRILDALLVEIRPLVTDQARLDDIVRDLLPTIVRRELAE